MLRVMTFNIRGAREDDGVNCWERRAALNVSVIRNNAPDLIGFQELMAANQATYDRYLPEYRFVLGPRSNRQERVFFNAIYWRPDRLQLLDSGGFYLSRRSDRWSLDWDSGRVRAATWGHFRCIDSGSEFVHLNTHLDHLGRLARYEGSRMIADFLCQRCARRIFGVLTGDFNSLPVRPIDDPGQIMPYTVLCEAGFMDSHPCDSARGARRPHTFHGFRGEAFLQSQSDEATSGATGLPGASGHTLDLLDCGGPDMTGEPGTAAENREYRLDWIMTLDGDRPVTACHCQIITTAYPPLFPSDHYPVVADLGW